MGGAKDVIANFVSFIIHSSLIILSAHLFFDLFADALFSLACV
jgi:hypothetical protein